MTAQGPASPDRNGSNNDNNGSPTSPVKVNDDKTVSSGSTQASQASSRGSAGPLSRSKNELEMLEEEIRQSEQLLEGNGTSSDAKEESQKLPSTPERGTADQGGGGGEKAAIDTPARSVCVSSSPSQEEESNNDQVVAVTPVRNHRSPATIDHAGNVSEIDSVSLSKDPLVPNTAEESSPSRSIPDAPSPARSTGSSGVWFSGIDANGQELSIDEPLKKQDTLNSTMSTRTDFEDELNTTIPESTISSTDGHDAEPVKQPKKKDPSATDPLEGMTNNHLSALFCCLVVSILGVIMFLVYVATQPDFVPPTSSPTMSFMPSYVPSSAPTDWVPSASPTGKPSFETMSPSDVPSVNPSEHPSREPSIVPTPAPSSIPSSNPTERDPAEDLTTVLATYSETLKDRIQQDLNSKQREAFEWLVRDPEFYTYSERKLIQRYVLALFALEMTVPNPGRQRNLRGNGDIHGERNLNWNSLETWLEYTDECTWFTSYYFDRVGCDRTGTWKRLVLYSLDLQGTIPSELALLTRMETLILSNHTISGTIPRELSNLPMLKKLDLSGNRLNGRIPVQFSKLLKLEELYLERNQLGNVIPPDFGSLTALRRMDVSTNGIVGRLPTQVGLMAALERLDVSDNQIGNSIPSEMGQLQQLRRLDLSGNGFLGNIPLQLGLYRLTHIDLHQNQLVGTVPARLGALRDLVYLDVSRNPLSGPFPAEVCSLKRGTFWNATSGQTESHTMFKADCAAVGCNCCTDCNY